MWTIRNIIKILHSIKIKVLLFFVVLFGCLLILYYRNKNKIQDYKPEVIFKINRLENDLFSCKNKDDIQKVIFNNKEVVKKIYKMSNDEPDFETVNRLYNMVSSQEMQQLYSEVQENFYNISDLNENLNIAFSKLKNEYDITDKPLRISTVITGLESDIYVDYEDIIIGIDYFLPKNSQFKKTQNKYKSSIYVRENIIIGVLCRFLMQLITYENDQNLLSDMIDYGKLLYLVKLIAPNIAKQHIFFYKKKELYEAEDNEKIIWEYFLVNKFLFIIDNNLKSTYLDNREFTSEVYKNCPGAIARWIGYNIVASYMKNNKNVNAKTLLNFCDHHEIFVQSKYNP